MLCCLAESWVLELSDWPECQHSQHHVTATKTESNDLLRFPTLGLSQPARSEEGVIRTPRGILLTVLSTITGFWLVSNFLCGSRNYLWFCFKRRSISFWHSFVVFFLRQIRSSNLAVRFSVRRPVGRGGARLGTGCRP